MRAMSTRFSLVTVLLLLCGCSSPTVPDTDAGLADTPRSDAAGDDAGAEDAASGDASVADTGLPLDAGTDAFVAIDAPPPPPVEQVDDGTVPLPHRVPCTPALAFRADGTPLLAVTDGAVRVMELVDRAWAQVGPAVSDSDIFNDQCPILAVGADDTIYAAFQQHPSPPFEFRMRRFDGTAWVDVLAMDSSVSPPVRDLDFAIDAAGEPVLGLLEPHPSLFGYAVNIYRMVDGEMVREDAIGSSDVSELRIALRPDDGVVALIQHTTGPFGSGVGLIELVDGAWVSHGDVETRGDTTTGLAIGSVDADASHAWITWVQTAAGVHTVHASEHDGDAYSSLDARFPALPRGSSPSIAHGPEGELVMAYADDAAFRVRRTEEGAPADILMPSGFGFLIDVHYEDDQLYAAYTLSSGGGSSNAVLVRLSFP